jgi:hypothetical protein
MATQTQSSKNNKWIFLGIGILSCIILVCVAAFLYITFFGGKLIGNSIAGGDYGETTDKFLQAMSQGDVEVAYQLVSSNGQMNIKKSDLEAMIKEGLFSEYKGFEVRSWNRGNFCDVSQPESSNSIGGRIRYNDNKENDFFFILENEDGIWKIYCMKIGKLGIP